MPAEWALPWSDDLLDKRRIMEEMAFVIAGFRRGKFHMSSKVLVSNRVLLRLK